MNLLQESFSAGKPFLKWAGGKNQLINSISERLPFDFFEYDTYIEPFVGGGAILFWVLSNFPNIKSVIINDINQDLSWAYQTVRENPKSLINELKALQDQFYSFENDDDKKTFYLHQRTIFNERKLKPIENTAILIFLNKTTFNGLYRVNSKNQFNVPFGKFSSPPNICNESIILTDSDLLQRVTVLNGDYTKVRNYISGKTFVYLDPPYKPLSKTSSFNSYSFETFDDIQQYRLYGFCKELNNNGVKWLLSNSDPKNTDPGNMFFDELYKDFSIKRVPAKRHINSQGDKRGVINELLIDNFNE
ncbi:MAG: Dam family site-specific DNA-(adenine-N6)-methyltransferase [Paludibacter sp.]